MPKSQKSILNSNSSKSSKSSKFFKYLNIIQSQYINAEIRTLMLPITVTSPPTEFEDLHTLERVISDYVGTIRFSKTNVALMLRDHLIENSGKYNALLNIILKSYALIDYQEEQTKKTVHKSFIMYAYDFLDLLMKILRQIEKEQGEEMNFYDNLDLIIEFADRKEEMLNTQYYPKAKEELASFHNKELRNKLDDNLKKFLNKHQKPRSHD
ncbi:MAG: hypothetical protein ACTSYI_09080 [Promethearchaeota archaeon]